MVSAFTMVTSLLAFLGFRQVAGPRNMSVFPGPDYYDYYTSGPATGPTTEGARRARANTR